MIFLVIGLIMDWMLNVVAMIWYRTSLKKKEINHVAAENNQLKEKAEINSIKGPTIKQLLIQQQNIVLTAEYA